MIEKKKRRAVEDSSFNSVKGIMPYWFQAAPLPIYSILCQRRNCCAWFMVVILKYFIAIVSALWFNRNSFNAGIMLLITGHSCLSY